MLRKQFQQLRTAVNASTARLLTTAASTQTTRADVPFQNAVQSNRAWRLQQFGLQHLRLEENLPIPTIRSPNQLLVKVHSSSINPIDVLMMDGFGTVLFDRMHALRESSTSKITYDRFPLTLGRDFAGTVMAVGSKVKHVKVGDQVWGAVSPFRNGSHCDLMLVEEEEITRMPDSVTYDQAASTPYSALTVWSALCTAHINPDNGRQKRVMILGASGGLGLIASQILKTWHCHVTAVCSSAAIPQVDEQCSLNRYLAYDRDADQLNQLRSEFDCILDFRPINSKPKYVYLNSLKTSCASCYVTATTPVLDRLDKNGLLLGLLKLGVDFGQLQINALRSKRQVRWAHFVPDRKALQAIADLVRSGSLKPTVEQVFNFNQLPQAFEAALAGHSRGRIVLKH